MALVEETVVDEGSGDFLNHDLAQYRADVQCRLPRDRAAGQGPADHPGEAGELTRGGAAPATLCLKG
jgi:hypothetical protein